MRSKISIIVMFLVTIFLYTACATQTRNEYEQSLRNKFNSYEAPSAAVIGHR